MLSSSILLGTSNLNDVIRKALVSVNVPALLETIAFVREEGLKKCDSFNGREDDILSHSHIGVTAIRLVGAAAATDTLKCQKYVSIHQGYISTPFIVESMGSRGLDTSKISAEICKKLVAFLFAKE